MLRVEGDIIKKGEEQLAGEWRMEESICRRQLQKSLCLEPKTSRAWGQEELEEEKHRAQTGWSGKMNSRR